MIIIVVSMLSLIPFFSSDSMQSKTFQSDVKNAHGLQVVTFTQVQGRVIVNLPDDMAAGDTISGTVISEPQGTSEQEKARNQDELNGYVIDLAQQKAPVGLRSFTLTVPQSQTSGGELTVRILAQDGREAGKAAITTYTKIIHRVSQPMASQFHLPGIGQQGRPIEISGPFDGNSSNTLLNWTAVGSAVQDFEKNTENVSGGFGLIPVAESPRKCVFAAPINISGPIDLHLKEGKIETTGEYRNLGVNLSAPKTNLRKGESTTLGIQVIGLQGIKEPVPLTLESQGVITMEGGNFQPLMIQPTQVGPDGRYSTTREITGVQTGVWGATVTVETKPFDICLQDDGNPERAVLINSFTGDYRFCAPGNSFTGRGSIVRRGATITLAQDAPDRRVQIRFSAGTAPQGDATLQTSSPKRTFTITDRDTRSNTCTCR